MSEGDDNKIITSSLDHKADEPTRRKVINDERYENNNLGGRVARTAQPDNDTAASEGRSWAMSEIERVVASSALSPSREKTAQFGLSVARRSDFRLKELSRKLGRQLKLDFSHEVNAGPVNRRIRDFDIQSQTMRMVTANATLGSLQFQKSQVLPYMRKSLALGYKQIMVLKGIHGGIGNLERVLSSKLEAIKLNTGAAAPFKESLVKRLKDAVAAKTMDRVATNLSNVVVDGYDEKYRKFISPRLSGLHQRMTTPGRKGGVNGVSRALTRKLNRLRRDTARVGEMDPGIGTMGRIKVGAARSASGLLGGIVRLGQKVKLSNGVNDMSSKTLGEWTSKLDRLQPFAQTDAAAVLAREFGERDHEREFGRSPTDLKVDGLTTLIRDWKAQSADHNKTLIGHVSAIRNTLVPSRSALGRNRNKDTSRVRGTHNRLSEREQGGTVRKIRANSYEDVQSRGKKGGFLSWSKRAGSKVVAAGGAAASAGAAALADADLSKPSSLLDNLKEQASSALQDKMEAGKEQALEQAKEKSSQFSRRAKIAMRRARRAGGRGIMGGAKGLFRGAGSGVRGIGRLGLKGIWGATKFGGKGLFSLAKGGLGLAAVAGVGQHLVDKYAKGEAKQTGNTLMSSLQYGAMGAQLGGFFGGIGAVPGAAIGASVGAVVANADFAAKALKDVGHAGSSVISGLWTTIFGQSAIVKPDGTVVRREKTSLLGDLKIAFFGRKAKLSSSGEVIAPERSNLIGSIQYGFQKLLFGDQFSNGEYKEGTSLAAIARKGIEDAMMEFGRQLKSAPSDIKKGWMIRSKQVYGGAVAIKDSVSKKAQATIQTLSGAAADAKKPVSSFGQQMANGYKNLSWKNLGQGLLQATKLATYISSPATFTSAVSNGVLGWSVDSGYIDSPTSPYYNFVTEVLSAYGIKARDQYRFVHSLEISQDKVNKGQSKAFDDADLAYMAGRFGFDPKNKDAVEYFKLWYKRRFMPAMTLIGQALKNHRLEFGSALSADKDQINAVTADLKKLLGASDIRAVGLEPTPQAYNRYAKIGASDPGGQSPSTMTKTTPFDPRDPQNRNASNGSRGNSFASIIGSEYGSSNYSGGGYGGDQPAARKNALMAKGGVKDQPEFKAAYQKLPPKLKKMVSGSKPLMFVLWSTAVQHGPDTASMIFQRDYSEGLDEKGYIRSIYQDRSTRFANLGGSDRAEAVSHLGEEQRFAMNIAETGRIDRNQASGMLSNIIDPSGNSQLGYDPSSVQGAPVKGDVASRARDAMQYLISKGYTRIAAAGIVGNLVEESKLKTNAIGDSGRAHGIAQWHPDRRAKIFRRFGKYVEAMNLREQLDAVDWEMRSGNGVTGGKNLANDLNQATSPGAAAVMVMNRYERPAERVNNGRRRAGIAVSVMKNVGTDGAANGATLGQASGGTPAPQTQGSQPQRGAAKPAAAKPASSRTPARKPEANHDQAWAVGLSKSLDNHAAVMKTYTGPMSKGGGDTNTVINSPILQHAAKAQGGFVAMSMKKSQVAAGH